MFPSLFRLLEVICASAACVSVHTEDLFLICNVRTSDAAGRWALWAAVDACIDESRESYRRS